MSSTLARSQAHDQAHERHDEPLDASSTTTVSASRVIRAIDALNREAGFPGYWRATEIWRKIVEQLNEQGEETIQRPTVVMSLRTMRKNDTLLWKTEDGGFGHGGTTFYYALHPSALGQPLPEPNAMRGPKQRAGHDRFAFYTEQALWDKSRTVAQLLGISHSDFISTAIAEAVDRYLAGSGSNGHGTGKTGRGGKRERADTLTPRQVAQQTLLSRLGSATAGQGSTHASP